MTETIYKQLLTAYLLWCIEKGQLYFHKINIHHDAAVGLIMQLLKIIPKFLSENMVFLNNLHF